MLGCEPRSRTAMRRLLRVFCRRVSRPWRSPAEEGPPPMMIMSYSLLAWGMCRHLWYVKGFSYLSLGLGFSSGIYLYGLIKLSHII